MAANFWRSIWAWLIAFGIAMIVSFFTKPRSVEELQGLVWGQTKIRHDQSVSWYRTPTFWGVVTMVVFVVLNLVLW